MRKFFKYFFRVILIILSLAAILFLVNWMITKKPLAKQKLNEKILNESLQSGRQFLMNNQYDNGSFVYEYNFVDQSFNPQNSQVRQAGALWGLTLIHLHEPTEASRAKILKGLNFLDSHVVQKDSAISYIQYPGDSYGSLGTMAITTLTLIDFLRMEKDPLIREKYEARLTKFINFLLSQRNEEGMFYAYYAYNNGKGFSDPSPYFNGETLLALIKAANYGGYEHLKPIILESAKIMYDKHVTQAREIEEDSDETKGYYQWGSMSMFEIYKAGWDDGYAEKVIELAYWMIDTHKTLTRTKNTAYAHEGMLHAWRLAQLTGNEAAMKKIGKVIDKGLYKLTTWQVEGPKENLFLRFHFNKKDPHAVGGIMNYCCDKNLRIDVTQHQMHAVTLALRYVYK